MITTLFVAAAMLAQQPSGGLLHPFFTDHAVLQRDQPVRIYGKAQPGEAVSVTLGNVSADARAGQDGRWMATLPAQPAGGPFTLTARTGMASATASDVMVGDVFLCSGQSNMNWSVGASNNSAFEIRASANPNLRMITVANAASLTPRDTFAAAVQWQVAAPATVGSWSGACYFMGRDLERRQHVAIGMIHASWGGANIRPFMSREALRAIPGYETRLDILDLAVRDQASASVRWGQAWQDWWKSRSMQGAMGEPWGMTAPGEWRPAPDSLINWERWGVPELASFNGMVWYRATVRLTAAQAAQAGTVSLGVIDEVDISWLNGRTIGATASWSDRRNYAVAAGSLRAGDNVVTVNALDTFGNGGMMGSAMLKLANGETIPITGWRWQMVPPAVGWPPHAPWESTGGMTTIYNAEIAPMGPYNVRAFVWYQGESNTSEPETYQALLTGLMADWRQRFQSPDAAWLVVQLPNYEKIPTAPTESGWAGVREAIRRAVQADPHAGMAVLIDAGDPDNLHPTNKQVVGQRLARAARKVVYGENIVPSGPTPRTVQRSGGDVVVTFGDIEQQLVSRSGPPNAFELCGPAIGSCRYVPARIDGAAVRLSVGDGPATRVRFCWGDAPVCTLYDGAGAPVGPFELEIP